MLSSFWICCLNAQLSLQKRSRKDRSEEHTSELQSRGHLVSRRLSFILFPYTTLFRASWIRFFLIAVKETAGQIQNKVVNMYDLYGTIKEDIVKMKSQYAQLFLDLLFERPIVSAKEIPKRQIGRAHV